QPVDYRRDPVNALNKLTDADTGWSYHGARWLAPDTAQWHTPDPPATAPEGRFMAQPWALHPSQYVLQTTVACWDPDCRHPAPLYAQGGVCVGRPPVDNQGRAQVFFAYERGADSPTDPENGAGFQLGVGLFNGPIGPGANGSAVQILDFSAGKFVDTS